MPGLRELRAPLAAGYLWLLCAWLVLADALPTKDEVSEPLDRLYELEPVVSDLGRAVVASVAAYIVGSIAIDLQARIKTLFRIGLERFHITIAGRFPLTDAGYRALDGMFPESLPPPAAEVRSSKSQQALVREFDLPPDSAQRGWVEAEAERLDGIEREHAQRNLAVAFWVARYREVTKTRLLDLSESLHSEVDRPDAEATFRMALWPPLATIAAYLAATVSVRWIGALVFPALVAWQWISLRRQANDALVTAIAARSELSDPFQEAIRSSINESKAEEQADDDRYAEHLAERARARYEEARRESADEADRST